VRLRQRHADVRGRAQPPRRRGRRDHRIQRLVANAAGALEIITSACSARTTERLPQNARLTPGNAAPAARSLRGRPIAIGLNSHVFGLPPC
jgi:hypothetical protein